MQKDWNVQLEENRYHIELNKNKIFINGSEGVKLSKYMTKKSFWGIEIEYTIPIEGHNVMLYIATMAKPVLVLDGRDCETREAYQPPTTPKWIYIFITLHAINILNGAIGGAFFGLGAILTLSVGRNQSLNSGLKLILSILILIGAYVGVFLIALLFQIVLLLILG